MPRFGSALKAGVWAPTQGYAMVAGHIGWKCRHAAPQRRTRWPGIAPPAWRSYGGMVVGYGAGTARAWADSTMSSLLHMETLLGHRVDCHMFTSKARRLAKGGASFQRSSFS